MIPLYQDNQQQITISQREVLKKINQLKGELVIKYYPTRTVQSIQSQHLQQCELQGIKPDMVLVDYEIL